MDKAVSLILKGLGKFLTGQSTFMILVTVVCGLRVLSFKIDIIDAW